ncbi:MAG: DNA polymerase III subunit delta [Proteobacteria bacterium]|nr:DNA polymerase III subunit delta [Pseudomonadota bacterium]MCH8951832.1 DNA polymerase III subunit delta [Pseudomonadota bacterium]
MKLAGARAAAFCARPGPEMLGRMAGALLHGPDAGLVALRRRELVDVLTEGDDLRLTRLEPAAALKDPAGIDAALRARGFFPGRRVVLIEGARDTLAGPLKAILAATGSGDSSPRAVEDAFLVVTASSLAARSALRRLFEGAGGLASLGLYPEPPGEAELARLLRSAGLGDGLTPEAGQDLAVVASLIDRGALLQLIEKISVFALDRDQPLGQAELAPLLPAAADSELDRLVVAVAEGRAEAVGPLIGRLAAAGIGVAGMLIATGRHFRQLLALAAARDGIDSALGRLRPPAFGPRRRALAAQTRRWGPGRLETANRLLFRADRTLRSAGGRPDRALVERCLIRLAMMAARG